MPIHIFVLPDLLIMNLNNQLTLSILSGEALTLHFGDVLQPAKEHLARPALVPVNQWDDDEEELEDDDDMDFDVDEEDADDEDGWEEEEFDIDEEDYDLEEEDDDVDFDSLGDDDEEDGYYDDEPEDMLGHQVEDRNPSPCNPAYAVEARMELL